MYKNITVSLTQKEWDTILDALGRMDDFYNNKWRQMGYYNHVIRHKRLSDSIKRLKGEVYAD